MSYNTSSAIIARSGEYSVEEYYQPPPPGPTVVHHHYHHYHSAPPSEHIITEEIIENPDGSFEEIIEETLQPVRSRPISIRSQPTRRVVYRR